MTHPPVPRSYRAAVAVARPVMRAMTRRRWEGGENLPQGGFIAAANHLSHVDPFTFLHFLIDHGRYAKVLAKHSLFTIPVLGHLFRSTGMIPVHRGTERAASALNEARARLAVGEAVAVFPEGTLTKDPDLWPMVAKTGVIRLALATRAPLIPVGQWGAQALLPRGRRIPRAIPRKPVTVFAGEAVDLSDLYDLPLDAEVLREGSARLMAAITALVARARAETPPATPFDPRTGPA
ncbi:lysophospholipid acyltransferase family protein [Pseudactinotalea sp. Z1748]|uniref:lysophospholipid acyltransferase family protein n=1 Tax=Pseudactinotalea sp. Z1748 TaxID=3413027 RepID=UPI003C7A4410